MAPTRRACTCDVPRYAIPGTGRAEDGPQRGEAGRPGPMPTACRLLLARRNRTGSISKVTGLKELSDFRGWPRLLLRSRRRAEWETR